MEKHEIYEILLNLSSVTIQDVILEEKKIMIDCELKSKSMKCLTCGEVCTSVHQSYTRQLRDLNISDRQVYLRVKIRQYICKNCNKTLTDNIDFADSNKSYTHRQADFMFLVGSKQSYAESAVILDMHPKTVERAILSQCKKEVDISNRYAAVKRLGIDEQSHQKGKKEYVCVLTDLDKGIIIDILKSRKKESLVAHFEALGKDFCKQITTVSCDCWQSYLQLSEIFFPHATIVLDRFHVIKLLNHGLDNFRKELRKNEEKKECFKQLKWVLYKQYHTLSDQELDDLHAAFEQSPTLKELYWMREKFNHILDNNTEVQTAIEQMDTWVNELENKKITAFDSFIKTLKSTKKYIANYVQCHSSNAVTEGLNRAANRNLIRSIKRIAFGMPNFENLRWRCLAISY